MRLARWADDGRRQALGGLRQGGDAAARRTGRTGPRAVKRPLCRYAYKSLGVDRGSYLATLHIDILASQPSLTKHDDP